VVRLSGTREEEGRAILADNAITSFTSMEEVMDAALTEFGIGGAQ
jgi:succinyl-CoA synthetase beta subunit